MEKEKNWYLMHAYGDYERNNPSKPDVDGSIQVLAAAEIWRKDRGETVGGFIFACGVPYKETTLGESMAAQLKKLIPTLPDKAIITEPTATTTRGEVKMLKRIAEGKNVKNIAAIGKNWHLKRIGINVKREFQHSIPLFSADEVLSELKPSRYEKIIKKWNKETEPSFRRREIFIQFINKIPFTNGQVLEIMDKLLGNKKIEFGVAKILKK